MTRAFTQRVERIHEDCTLSSIDASELLSKAAEVPVAEIVDPNCVAVVKINKKFLPAPSLGRPGALTRTVRPTTVVDQSRTSPRPARNGDSSDSRGGESVV